MKNSIRTVVILGAGYAGLACALRLRCLAPQLRITLLDARAHFCERIRLHQVALGWTPTVLPFAELLHETGIHFVQAKVQELDPQHRTVQTSVGNFAYDRLVFALGSDTRPNVKGASEYADAIASIESTQKVAAKLRALPARAQVAVVGGGLTGLECATEIAEGRPDLQVSLFTNHRLGNGLLSESAAMKVRAVLDRLQIALHEHVAIESVSAQALHHSTASFPFDCCIWTTGFASSDLAQRAGLTTTSASRLALDATLRAIDQPTIYGVGDAAQPIVDVGAPVLMSCRLGLPAGLHAAQNLAAEFNDQPLQNWNITDAARCISLGRSAAILQFHRKNGELRDASYAGKGVVWLKEAICRGTVWFLRREAKRAAKVQMRGTAKLLPSWQGER